MQLLTIKQLREKRGCSARQAAEVACTSEDTIRKWERGKVTPRYIYTFNKLLQFYGVKLSRDDQLALEKAFERRIDLRRIKFKVEA